MDLTEFKKNNARICKAFKDVTVGGGWVLILLLLLSPAYAGRYTNKPTIDPVVATEHRKLFAPRLVETPVVPSEYIPLIEKMGLPKRRLWKWGR